METPNAFSFQLLGWILFIICALFYIAANIRSGDWLCLTGSILFLMACVVFVTPMVLKPAKRSEKKN